MIRVKHKGNFSKTESFLKRANKQTPEQLLIKYGELGVQALSEATPVLTGKTAASWSYEIVRENGTISIFWNNSNIKDYVRIAVILDLGHGTGTGGYVQGRNYIKPAIRPIFDRLAGDAWKEVTNAK